MFGGSGVFFVFKIDVRRVGSVGSVGSVWRVRSVFGIKNNVIAVKGDVVSLGVIK